MTRLRGRVDANQADIVAALRRAGCGVYSLADVGHGCPDLLVWSPVAQRLHLLEVKTARGKLTPAEQRWHNEWPGDVSIVRSVEEALIAVGRM